MFEFFNRKKSNDREQGVAYVCDKELKKEIRRWLKSVYLDDVPFENVLLKLGLNLEKTIYLKKVSNTDGLSFYYGYEPKIESKDRIDFCTLGNDKYSQIKNDNCMVILSGNSYRKTYHFVYDGMRRDGFRFDKQRDMFIVNMDNGMYFREMDLYGFCIRVKNKDNNEIILNCSCRLNFNIKNELELEEYLLALDTEVLIDKIYKKICELSLDDESKFSKIDLTILKDGIVMSSLSYSKEDLYTIFTSKREFKIKDKDRDITYSRHLPPSNSYDKRDNIKIELMNGDYKFIMDVKRKSYGGISNLANEIELRNYLLNLKFPILIDDIFNDICKITDLEGRDSKVSMSVYYREVNTDLLCFEYDKLKELKIIRDDKEVTYIDGFFSYISMSGNRKIYVDIIDEEVVKCGMDSSNGNGYKQNVDNLLVNPVDEGIKEAYEVECKIRKMINNMFIKR